LGFFSKSSLFSLLITSLFVQEKISQEKIDEMKSEDILKDLFANLPARYDSIKQVIIDERDRYLAEKIRQKSLELQSGRLLAVVGAGHLAGIQNYLQHSHELEPLETLPAKTWMDRLQFWIFPVFFSSLFLFTFLKQGRSAGTELVLLWIIAKSGLAGLGALLALAHPLSILLAMVVAPFGNFNPVLKPGWVAALAESWLRKPLVTDFENIAKDTEKLSGYWKNRVVRIFLVLLLPQLGSSLGTFLATWIGLSGFFSAWIFWKDWLV